MPSKTFNTAPLYVQLRTDLARRIARGDWKRGDLMPNEIELAREYGLSPGTVRKALDWLEEARLIVRQQGRGTFILGTTPEELERRYNRLRSGLGDIVATVPQVLESGLGQATTDEAAHLNVREGAQVYRLKRLCHAHGRPLMVERYAVSTAVFPSLLEPADAYDLAALSQQNGVLLGSGSESLSLASAPDEVGALLNLAPGARVLRLVRTIRDIEGHPVEWRRCWCDLEGYVYQVELH